MGKRLPGSAGHIGAAEFPGQLVEVVGGAVAALVQNQLQGLPVALGFGEFGHRRRECLPKRRHGGEDGGVVDVLADTAVEHEPLTAEHPEAGRDAGLAHAEGLLEFRNGQLLLKQECQQTQAGRLGKSPE